MDVSEVPKRVDLRPAAATAEEGHAFAHLLNEAGAGMYKMMLGRKYSDVIGRAFMEPGHDHSFQFVTFAERDGRVVGMLSAYTAEDHRRSDHEPLVRAAGWRRFRMNAYLRFMSRLFDFMDNLPDGDFYVQGLAVDNNERGLGIGSVLLDYAEDLARKAGAQRIALDVAATNKGGKRLYDRRGMTPEDESPRWFRMPNTNVIRMVKSL